MITITVPGSKSITNRALLIAALANGKSELRGALESEDTIVMQKALRNLGIRIHKNGTTVTVHGGVLHKTKPIFCDNSGTTMRFLTAVLATQNFESVLDGNVRMRQRPILDLVDALEQLGAKIVYLKKHGYPSIKIKKPIMGGICKIRGEVSSQFISGLLLAAPLAKKDVTIKIIGDLVSKPYVDLTLELMRHTGILVQRYGYREFRIKAPQPFRVRNYTIEGDASSASYFWGISSLTGEKIKVKNVPKDSLQADAQFLLSLRALAKQSRSILDCFGLRPRNDTTIPCSDFPDSAMTLAVLCAFTKGKFRLTGLSNLRLKECDRLHALATELRRIGCEVSELRDGLVIKGDPEKLHPAAIKTYNDHRMAMCFGMASVVLPGIKIKNPGCVKKTYPNFWKDLASVKKKLSEKNIILTGMRGSGKTKIGRLIAKKLRRRFIDIDEEIIKAAKKTIPEIVANYGWKGFRVLERKIVEHLKEMKHAVIATGGGTLMSKTNERMLKQNGKVIFLQCEIAALKKRLVSSLAGQNRPSLTGRQNFLDELGEVYEKRKKRYLEVADIVFDVSENSRNKQKDIQKKTEKLLKQVHSRLFFQICS